MKKELPFVVNYTKEMSVKFNTELMESKKCPVEDPKFYSKWDLVSFGTPEYYERFKVTRKDVEGKN
jgi:hypothetical protein